MAETRVGMRVLIGSLLGLVAGAAMAMAALAGVGFGGDRPYLLGAATGALTALTYAAATRGRAPEAAVKAVGAGVIGVGAIWIVRHWAPGRIAAMPVATLCLVGVALGVLIAADRRAR